MILVRDGDGVEGRGFSKKRNPFCNGMNKGSNFILSERMLTARHESTPMRQFCLMTCSYAAEKMREGSSNSLYRK
ncbi:hypothetical protein [Methanosarcina vacuolata]|uniref:hypothetical protein n=1 Tax=Methanosarcina vacuolata TaxID=2215 RepID=UPI0012F62443|nr:hypothetical protein [Methanosarcina vacuolata]